MATGHRLVLLALAWACTMAAASDVPVFKRSDCVYVAPSNYDRLPYILASRVWRKGIPAVVGLPEQPQPPLTAETAMPATLRRNMARNHEQVVHYPDFRAFRNGMPHLTPGDRRQAMMPLLAHRLMEGKFKWMLLGDDDTPFFMAGVKRLLYDLDPEDPLFITSAVICVLGTKHPCRHIACGTCRSSPPPPPISPSVNFGAQLPNCTCTPAMRCKELYPEMETSKCLAKDQIGAHWYGGSGAIVSAGFFKRLYSGGRTFADMENCINNVSINHHIYGGDGILTSCLWHNNMPITYPEIDAKAPKRLDFFGGMSLYDPPRIAQHLMPRENDFDAVARYASAKPKDVDMVTFAVSTHLWSKLFVLGKPRADVPYYVAGYKHVMRAYDFVITALRVDDVPEEQPAVRLDRDLAEKGGDIDARLSRRLQRRRPRRSPGGRDGATAAVWGQGQAVGDKEDRQAWAEAYRLHALLRREQTL